MVEVHTIKPGSIKRTSSGMILDARSSVTLIVGEKRIIVDTGNVGDEELILSGLRGKGFGPDEIDTVINTHAHGATSRTMTSSRTLSPCFTPLRDLVGGTSHCTMTNR